MIEKSMQLLYMAVHHYQKQGLCEGNEYEELDDAFKEVEVLREQYAKLKSEYEELLQDALKMDEQLRAIKDVFNNA